MRQFKWIEWNLHKIDAQALSVEEVEASFDHVFRLEERKDGSYQMFAETPSGPLTVAAREPCRVIAKVIFGRMLR
jgi:hypothetical protein